jgi:hypothetical protein
VWRLLGTAALSGAFAGLLLGGAYVIVALWAAGASLAAGVATALVIGDLAAVAIMLRIIRAR